MTHLHRTLKIYRLSETKGDREKPYFLFILTSKALHSVVLCLNNYQSLMKFANSIHHRLTKSTRMWKDCWMYWNMKDMVEKLIGNLKMVASLSSKRVFYLSGITLYGIIEILNHIIINDIGLNLLSILCRNVRLNESHM